MDRPAFLVEQVLKEFEGQFFGVKYLDFPILSEEGGERFMEASNIQLQELAKCKPDWVLFQDDDRWFEPLGIDEELLPALQNPDIDLWYATSWFIWNCPEQFNANRHHHSPVLFRYQPGQRFPTDRMLQAPLPVHDEAIVQGRAATLKTPLFDFGTYTHPERCRVYNEFLAAGKADEYVESIQAVPRLVLVGETLKRPWRDLWTEEYGPQT